MRRIDMDSAIRRVRDVRLALAGLLVLSMTANLALTMSFAGRETVDRAGAGGGRSRLGSERQRGGQRPGRRTVSRRHGAHGGGDAAHAHARERRSRPPRGGAAEPCLGAGRDRRLVEAEAARMAGRDMASAFYPTEIEAESGAARRRDRGRAGDLDRARGVLARGPALPPRLPRRRGPHRAPALRTDGDWTDDTETSGGRFAPLIALALACVAMLAAPAPVSAMQISRRGGPCRARGGDFPQPASTASRSAATGSRRWCARRTGTRSSTTPLRATSISGRYSRMRPRAGSPSPSSSAPRGASPTG